MKLYGYAKSSDDLLELEELTLQGEPETLRQLAKFLDKMADGIENDREDFGHGHANDYCFDWPEDAAEITVFKPAS
jgi:hypothetical protein